MLKYLKISQQVLTGGKILRNVYFFVIVWRFRLPIKRFQSHINPLSYIQFAVDISAYFISITVGVGDGTTRKYDNFTLPV